MDITSGVESGDLGSSPNKSENLKRIIVVISSV